MNSPDASALAVDFATTCRASYPSDTDPRATALYTDHLEEGAVLGNYVVMRQVGSGGHAAVYEGRHRLLGRPVAIKVLFAGLVAQNHMLERFRREAQALGGLGHPHIVDVTDCGELFDGRPYYIMEWLEGRTLADQVADGGPMSLDAAVGVFEQLGGALSAAHAAGIIHRDVKGSNVMLSPGAPFGRVKLLDFGVAKLLNPGSPSLTSTGTIVGTPEFMAPEQLVGEEVTARTDIYALGALLFQVLTGRVPFLARTRAEVERLHILAPPPAASDHAAVPWEVDRVIRTCMQKEQQDRYQSVDELLEDLRPLALAL